VREQFIDSFLIFMYIININYFKMFYVIRNRIRPLDSAKNFVNCQTDPQWVKEQYINSFMGMYTVSSSSSRLETIGINFDSPFLNFRHD